MAKTETTEVYYRLQVKYANMPSKRFHFWAGMSCIDSLKAVRDAIQKRPEIAETRIVKITTTVKREIICE